MHLASHEVIRPQDKSQTFRHDELLLLSKPCQSAQDKATKCTDIALQVDLACPNAKKPSRAMQDKANECTDSARQSGLASLDLEEEREPRPPISGELTLEGFSEGEGQ